MSRSFQPIFAITNRIAVGLAGIERARGFLDAWVMEGKTNKLVYRLK